MVNGNLSEVLYNITEHDGNYYINGILIPSIIFETEIFEYEIKTRIDFIDLLFEYIVDSKRNNRLSDLYLQKKDLELMQSINCDYILSSINTNHYLYGNSEKFNTQCGMYLVEAK